MCGKIEHIVYLVKLVLQMKRISMKKIVVSGALVAATVLMIPGCGWFGSSETPSGAPVARTGEAAIKLGGVNIFSTDDFRQYLELVKQMQPGFSEQLAGLPEEQQRNIFLGIVQNLVSGALAKKLLAQEGWDKDAAYQANAQRLHDELDRNLATMEIQKRIADRIKPTVAELKAWYEKNRATHPYMKYEPFVTSSEGVQAFALKAKDEAQAQQLAASAKVAGRGLKKAAGEIGAKADDLGLVTAQSTKPDRVVVMKILGAQTFPTVEVVKSGDSWWVVESASKKEAEFAPFEAVQMHIEQLVKNDVFMQEFQAQMKKLREQNKEEINEAFINSLIVKPAA